jgi:predicted dehydrogenase
VVPSTVPNGPPFYTGRLLARLAEAIRAGHDAVPNFADALACHHLLDAVQRAADTGQRVTIAAG